MNWRHRMALERFVAMTRPIRFPIMHGVGEKTFKAAIDKGWIVPINPDDKSKWWERNYRATEAARAALKEGLHDLGRG